MNTSASARPVSHILAPSSWVEPLPLAEIFPRPAPLEVELGSGDGSFLAQWAAAHPEHNFLGVERLLGRLRKLDRKAKRLGLDHLRLIRIEASYLLQYLLPPASTRALHLYFPDPWPKRKHRKHRLVNDDFTTACTRILEPGGAVHLRTDDANYFEQMTEVFARAPRFTVCDTSPALLAVQTDFERTFLAQGISTRHASYRLTG